MPILDLAQQTRLTPASNNSNEPRPAQWQGVRYEHLTHVVSPRCDLKSPTLLQNLSYISIQLIHR